VIKRQDQICQGVNGVQPKRATHQPFHPAPAVPAAGGVPNAGISSEKGQ
jgi:hypothetical protein